MDDNELLRAYAADGSEQAFATLLSRNVNLIYSAALRRVLDPQLAEEVTQTVFCLLARKAASIPPNTVVIGWLYNATRFTASNVLRAERRRRQRELKVVQMQTPNSESDIAWEQLSPHLDEAMHELSESDRVAVLLRFFQGKAMHEIGQIVGISEDAAKKRVTRAVERLRAIFLRQGVVYPAVALGALLSARAVQAAPPAFVLRAGATIASQLTALHAPASITSKLLLMANINLKTASIATICILAALNAGLVSYNHWNSSAPPPRNGRFEAPAPSSPKEVAPTQSVADQLPIDPSLAAAIARLRAVLYDPGPPRRYPKEKLTEALALFGANRKAALPVLMEVLNGTNWFLQGRAYFGLKELGTNGADDLKPAIDTLFEASEKAGNEIHQRVMDAYVRYGQNYLNNMTPGQVITLANAVRTADPRMYRLFVDRLVQSNPVLASKFNHAP